MCTISWLVGAEKYEVFFNRDEQKKRELCLNLDLFKLNNKDVLMPIDPQGGGSWISTNDVGLTICLLNLYQQCSHTKTDVTTLKSRGLLLKNLAECGSEKEVRNYLSIEDLSSYLGFTILVFDFKQLVKTKAPNIYQWNGKSLQSVEDISPITSSSVDFENTQKTRKSLYPTLVNRKSLLDFHRQHSTPSHQGVCMHREDAHTVSFSHICVSKEKSVFEYLAGSLCNVLTATKVIKTLKLNIESDYKIANY